MTLKEDKIKKILFNSVQIERWAEKSNLSYTFLEDAEVEEIVANILKNLNHNGYVITKKKKK